MVTNLSPNLTGLLIEDRRQLWSATATVITLEKPNRIAPLRAYFVAQALKLGEAANAVQEKLYLPGTMLLLVRIDAVTLKLGPGFTLDVPVEPEVRLSEATLQKHLTEGLPPDLALLLLDVQPEQWQTPDKSLTTRCFGGTVQMQLADPDYVAVCNLLKLKPLRSGKQPPLLLDASGLQIASHATLPWPAPLAEPETTLTPRDDTTNDHATDDHATNDHASDDHTSDDLPPHAGGRVVGRTRLDTATCATPSRHRRPKILGGRFERLLRLLDPPATDEDGEPVDVPVLGHGANPPPQDRACPLGIGECELKTQA